jgi:hypothetical protein
MFGCSLEICHRNDADPAKTTLASRFGDSLNELRVCGE